MLAAALWSEGVALAQLPPTSTPQAPGASVTPPGPQEAGNDVSVEAEASPRELHVGDRATITLTLTYPQGYAFDAPPAPERIDAGRIRVLSVRRSSPEAAPDGGPGRTVERLEYDVTIMRIGRFYFPALALHYIDGSNTRRVVRSPTVSLKVATVIEDPEPSLRPDRGGVALFEPDHRPLWAAGMLLVVAALVALGWLLARRVKRKPSPIVVAPPKPPWERAKERLEALQAMSLEDNDARRAFFFELSEIVREYLGARFAFDSLELTTSELLARLRGTALPKQLRRERLEGFLLDCDLVKFAKYKASEDETSVNLDIAHEVVDKTRPRQPPAAQDAAKEDAHVG